MKMPLVLTRSTIRLWRSEDAESLVRHANNRRVSITLRDRFPYPYTIDNAREFLTRALGRQPAENFCIDVDGAAVGGVGIHPQADIYRYTAEIGYWLGEDFWGRGIMTEVVTAFTDSAFEVLGLRRICAHTYSSNPASARVLEKAGFALEGRLKNSVFKEGELLDSFVYAKTR